MITNDKQHAAAQNKLAMLEAPLAQKPDNALPDIICETGAGQQDKCVIIVVSTESSPAKVPLLFPVLTYCAP